MTWNIDGVSFDGEPGTIVAVSGTVGSDNKMDATAKVRIAELPDEADQSTSPYNNLALNEDATSQTYSTTDWPVARSYSSVSGRYVTYIIDGVRNASGTGNNVWTSGDGTRHQVIVAFGAGSKTGKLQTVNMASLDFALPDGSALPDAYKIQYYSGSDGLFPSDRLFGTGDANHVSNTKNWSATNPVNLDDNWTDVTFVGDNYPAAAVGSLVNVAFQPVKTSALRVVFTPEDGGHVSLDELEFYYRPVEENADFTVEEINIGGTNKLNEFDDDNVLTLDTNPTEVTAKATNNASVTILDEVGGKVRIRFVPENGDESKVKEYTIQFKTTATGTISVVSASDSLIKLDTSKAAAGATVKFRVETGYEFDGEPTVVKSEDQSDTGIAVTKAEDGSYSFEMPEYAVTVQRTVNPIQYSITYNLDGGEAANPAKYTIETPTFTLNNPTKAGYTFLGWTSAAVTEATKKMSVQMGTTGNLIFTANWIEGELYFITFNSNGGTLVAGQQVDQESAYITEPDEPTKRFYTFEGWYSDPELNTQWDFNADQAESDMALYAKWSEAEIEVNTQMPDIRYFDQPFNLPGNINITVGQETLDVNVVWDAATLEKIMSATEAGKYELTGRLEALNGRGITVEIVTAPANIVYFVDSGASEFTENGRILVAANAETLKNQVPDLPYDGSVVWGFTNDASNLEVNGSGDEYTTIRNFKSSVSGKTLTYQFALDQGDYDVTVGFYDPWAQWAGDNRHAKITLVDANQTELEVEADHHISGEKTKVDFFGVEVQEAGDVTLNIAPTKSGSNSDVMVSFIVISKNVENKTHTITFYSDDEKVTEQTVLSGSKAVRPADPKKEEFTFDGWYKEATLETLWDFNTDVVTDDTGIYAKWVKNEQPVEQFVVTFDSNGGTEVVQQIVDKGGKATKPTNPARTSYTFDGWYVDETLQTAYDFDSAVTKNMILYAKWTKNSSGSSGGSSKPSASVNGDGGKVNVSSDGTVIITPAAGYKIGSIIVNGKSVEIPPDGKLTGLDEDDKVVVTFKKIDEKPIEQHFTDVADTAWYSEAVNFVLQKELFNGTSENTFSPEVAMTRGMLVTVLHRLAGRPTAISDGGFTDVSDQYYADAVTWAAQNGIINGVGDNAFAPNANVTREQMAAILYRYAGQPTVDDIAVQEFADSSKISSWANNAMRWAVAEGLLSGKGNNVLDPRGNATRAEVATILMRFVQNA